ncbi:Na+/H+ antiporter subunit E [Gilvimarinus sp. F26214L]|uniref:Na+/H+ antiporter subunit E n=1 Tax=Gilvimarinus sp. DZF01 TaxID=3461371 RepID=UPI004045EED8
MRHTVSIFTVLSLIWLLNSGHYTALLLALGLLSVIVVVWIAHLMDVVDHESQPFHLTIKLPGYYWWLLRQLVASNIDVAVRVWRGPAAISPCMASLPMSQRTDMGKVIYANSITLTPGTVAMDLQGDTVIVHSLTSDNIADLRKGEMDRRVSQLEK